MKLQRDDQSFEKFLEIKNTHTIILKEIYLLDYIEVILLIFYIDCSNYIKALRPFFDPLGFHLEKTSKVQKINVSEISFKKWL